MPILVFLYNGTFAKIRQENEYFLTYGIRMFGKIGIQNLRINCIIGCNPEERVKKQDIFIDVLLKSDFSACVLSDEIADTINYVKIAERCIRIAQSGKYSLLEVLAYDILNNLISDPNIVWAFIRIKKPDAISDADYATIELETEKTR